MQKLKPSDLYSLEQYSRDRPAIRAKVMEHKRVPPGRGGAAPDVALRGPHHHPVPDPGDAARRADLRVGRHRGRAGGLQPADPGRHELESDAPHRVSGREGAPRAARTPRRASRTAAGCRWPGTTRCSRSRTRTSSARTTRRPRRCTSCASSSRREMIASLKSGATISRSVSTTPQYRHEINPVSAAVQASRLKGTWPDTRPAATAAANHRQQRTPERGRKAR